MAINFPNSPVTGTTYDFLGIRYEYALGGYWKVVTAGTLTNASTLEIDTGTDPNKIITPLALEASKYIDTGDAATPAEIALGTNNTKFVTPAGLSSNTPVVTGHVRAGNKYLHDGSIHFPSAYAPGFISILDVSASNVYETYGPTGSGADNIVNFLDILPSNATMWTCTLISSLEASSGSVALTVFARAAGVTTSPSGLVQGIMNHRTENTDVDVMYHIVDIPLGAGNIFELFWQHSNSGNIDTESISMGHRGFHVDV